MSARFLAAGLVASTAWFTWQGYSAGLSPRSVSLRVMLWSFVAALVGKAVGIASSLRHRRGH